MLTKEPYTQPYTQTITPWHQDLPYYNINGMRLRIALGSMVYATYSKDNQAKWFAEGTLSELPTDSELRQYNEILGWEMKPGDIIIFNMLKLHASKGVPSNQRRRVLSLRFMGDDAKFAPRAWKTYPDFQGLNERLEAGSKMEDELFPLVYPQSN
jgi:ectoine hydroxylase-related dioxygenase (phytanoyl-CoA dioxygenase family)